MNANSGPSPKFWWERSEFWLAFFTFVLAIATGFLAYATYGLKTSTDLILSEEKNHAGDEWKREVTHTSDRVTDAMKSLVSVRECEQYIIDTDIGVKEEAKAADAINDPVQAVSLLEAVAEDKWIDGEALRPSKYAKSCFSGFYSLSPSLDISKISDQAKIDFIINQINYFHNVMTDWAASLSRAPEDGFFEKYKKEIIDNFTEVDVRFISLLVNFESNRIKNKHMSTQDIAEGMLSICAPIISGEVKKMPIDCVNGRLDKTELKDIVSGHVRPTAK